MKLRKYSLKIQIATLLIGLTIFMLAAFLISFLRLKQHQVSLVKEAELSKTEKLAEKFDLFFENRLRTTRLVSAIHTTLYNKPYKDEVMQDYLHTLIEKQRGILNLYVVYDTANQLLTKFKIQGYNILNKQHQQIDANSEQYIFTNKKNADLVSKLKNSEVAMFSNPIKDTATGWYLITAGSAIFDSKNQYAGYVGADISTEYLTEMLKSFEFGEHAHSHLATPDGNYLATDNKIICKENSIWDVIGKDSAQLQKEFELAFNQKTTHVLDVEDQDTNTDIWLFIVPIRTTNLLIISAVPARHLLEETDLNMLFSISVLLIAFAITLLVSAYFISRQFLNPVLAVSNAAHNISNGDYLATIQLKSYNKETSDLVHNFNTMTGQIHMQHILLESRISEHQEIEKKLLATQTELELNVEKFRKFFYTIPDGVYIEEAQSGLFVEINESFAKIFNYTRDEIIGHTAIDFGMMPDQTFRTNLFEEFKKTNSIHNFEFTSKTKDNVQITISLSASFFKSENTEYIVGVIRDVTQEKINLEETQRAKMKAEESDELKNAFLQNMSHEIRTPLNAIVGFAELISHSTISPENKVKFGKIISNNSRKLISIITDIIEISQIQSGLLKLTISEFSIVKLLQEIQTEYRQYAIEKNLEFDFIHDIPENFTIQSDYGKIERIITHAIDNAIKFTSQGTISVYIQIIYDNLEITVSDTGIGISEDMQKIIFEPFRQVEAGLRRNYGGNGLGLAIIKAYIDMLNGTVMVQSKESIGSTFKFRIPVAKPQLETERNTKTKINTVLVVEDEYANQILVKELLLEKDLNVLIATNGSEAVDICRERTDIDLILMDIKMPVMDGQTATKLIREFSHDIKIIALTAFALEIEKEAFRREFDDYIIKPISPNELFEKLSNYIF